MDSNILSTFCLNTSLQCLQSNSPTGWKLKTKKVKMWMLWGNGWFCHPFGGFFWLNFHESKRKDPSSVLFLNEQPQPFWRIFAKSGYWILQLLSWVLTIPAVWQMSRLHSLADFRFSMWNIELPDPRWSNGCVGFSDARKRILRFFLPSLLASPGLLDLQQISDL